MLNMQSLEVDMHHASMRKEKHGKDRKLGIDITVKVKTSNTILDEIEKGLVPVFFRKAKKDEQLDLEKGGDALVVVKHPSLTNIPYGNDFPGYEAEIVSKHEGGDVDSLFLSDVTLKDISWNNIEGGSVDLTFKLQAGVEPEDLAVVGELYTHKGVLLTLTPPTAKMQGDAANDADGAKSDAA